MSPQRAWACLLTNALVLPGLGTFLGGRRVSGVLQAGLAFAGFTLMVVWFGYFFFTLYRSGHIPEGISGYLLAGLLGLAAFGAAWLWSLLSGLGFLRAVRGS